MFNLKKLFSVLTIAALLISAFSSFAYAAIPSDVIGTEHEEATEVLSALGIMVGDAGTGLFRPSDAIKRSEVTKVAVALKGLTNVANSSSGVSKFPDVSINHWANGYINVGTTEGLIIGDDTGNFRPDDQVSYSEAVTILVRALGYEPQAISKGGYPTGYVVTANSTGLSKGVSAAANKLISRGDVAELAYNALTIKLMEQVNYGNSIKYEVVDKTLLKDNLDVELIEGEVTAVGNASTDGTEVDKNQIKIDGKVYNRGNADVRKILGFNVDAYIISGSSSSKKDTLLLALPSEGKNNVLEIYADNLNSIDSSSGSKVINYSQSSSNKTMKATVSDNATVMYNGKLGQWSDIKMIESGSITLLDSSKNGKYNIVFVNETTNYVVDETVLSSNRVIDKYDQSALVLDPDDEEVSYIIDKDRKIIDIKELSEWDVITLTISKDGKLIYGTVTENPVEGEITETSKDGVYINGKKYKVASNYPYALKINDKGIFYLDAEGKIAAYSEDENDAQNYAFLADMGMDSGLNANAKFKLFTHEGKTVTLNAANKMRVNDKSGLKPVDAIDAIGEKGQLITYELNSNGEISRINTSISSSEIDEDKFIHNFTESEVVYKSSSSKLLANAMNIKVTAGTVIFDIPSSSSRTDDYAIRNNSFFVDGSKYDIMAFDVRENLTAGVIIVTNSDNRASEETSVAVVDRITNAKNDSGEDVERLYAYQDGKEIVLLSSKKGIFNKGSKALESGDIIQYKTNGANEVDGITVLFDISNSDKEQSIEHSANMITEYGKVTKKFSDSFNLSVNGGAENNYSIGNANIYIAETVKSKIKISSADASDIQKYDSFKPERIFVRIYKDEVKDIVIVRN